MGQIFKRGGWWRTVVCCTAVAFVSCNDDDLAPDPEEPSEHLEVNNWILENMREYYYWNNVIPAEPDKSLDPESFFYSELLNGDYVKEDGEWVYQSGEDKFSWMQNIDELSDGLSGRFESFGYEVQAYVLQDNNTIFGRVLYTYRNSPAAEAGLERGNVITKVNGQELDRSNYVSLLYGQEQQTLTLGTVNEDFTAINDTASLSEISSAEIQEEPVFLDSVYTISGKKIGYLVYNSFIPAPAGSPANATTFDDQVDDIFGSFKTMGVNELVLDLRYNLGGSIASAANLASLISPSGVNSEDIFALYEWNQDIEDSQSDNNEFQESKRVHFRNEANKLNTLQKIYVLVSRRTASASELIINGLRPYMEVVTIGDENTLGKNVGSVTIEDEEGEIEWGLQPIVIKIYNSENQSDYANGFAPNHRVDENWLLFGDINESFLGEALNLITGGGVITSTESLRKTGAVARGRMVGTSLDRKPGAGEMYVEPSELPVVE